MNNIILASKSIYRAQLLTNAGISFTQQTADIDERIVEQPLLNQNSDADDIAELLAIAKAQNVSQANSQAYIIGSDQTLSFEGKMLHKPNNMEEARKRLLLLSGKAHELNSAVVLVKDQKILWTHVNKSIIKFRDLTPKFIGQHLASVGDKALSSVGAYQIEGEGVQLFEKIDGDFFSIMGLPLLPLLAQMRELKIINAE